MAEAWAGVAEESRMLSVGVEVGAGREMETAEWAVVGVGAGAGLARTSEAVAMRAERTVEVFMIAGFGFADLFLEGEESSWKRSNI